MIATTILMFCGFSSCVWAVWKAAHMSAGTAWIDSIAVGLIGMGGLGYLLHPFANNETQLFSHIAGLLGLVLWAVMPAFREITGAIDHYIDRLFHL